MAAAVKHTGINYSKWSNFADSSDEEGEHATVVQGGERSAEADFEHARRAQELDEEVTTDTAQLAMLRKQRKDVTEAIRAQSGSSSSQWMLIGGSSFAKVPSKQVAETLNKGAHSPRPIPVTSGCNSRRPAPRSRSPVDRARSRVPANVSRVQSMPSSTRRSKASSSLCSAS